MSELRDRIAAAIRNADESGVMVGYNFMADAVISELDLGIPCAANGCKVRRIALYHAEKSSQLSPEADDE